MAKIRQRRLWFAFLAILLVFAACKGESPTAPPVGGGNPPTGGGGTPTSGYAITLSASPASLEVERTSVITATVTNNGQPVPDGTAVEFVTSNGTFVDTGANTTVRTTTGGVAAASLTSTTAGNATVAVTVNNVTRNTTVVFSGKNYAITVTATPSELQVGQNAAIVVNVTHSGQAVPDGTPVELTTNLGTFNESGSATLATTVTGGTVRATLTSPSPGTATITARVLGTTAAGQVSFRGSSLPTITSVSPNFGRPTGGETIRITGTNFRGRVRVFFDVGETQPIEAMVVSVTPTELTVITPPVNLAPGEQLQARISVVVDADTANEARVTAAAPFDFRSSQLTPTVTTISPNSGPPQGGTIVTIFGSSFQAPVQVLFGEAEARVLETHFDNIKVQVPSARDANGTGAPSAVPVTVVNINSGTRTSLAAGFRYTPAMAITAIGPNQGPYTGGTRVSIDGVGFDDPVAVTIAGVGARVIDARSGTKLIVETVGVDITSCGDVSGPVVVTNIETGVSATGPTFIYRVPKPAIVGVSPASVTEGGSMTVTVANAQPGVNRIKIGDRVVFPTATTFNADGSATFTVTVPSTFTFTTEPCAGAGGVAGVRDVPLVLDVVYTNVQTTCSDTADDALIVTSADTSCRLPAAPVAGGPSPASGTVPTVAAAGAVTAQTAFTVTNNVAAGGQSLSITGVTATATNGATVTVTPTSASVAPQGSQAFTVTVDPGAAGAYTGTVTMTTNDPTKPTLTFNFSGNAT